MRALLTALLLLLPTLAYAQLGGEVTSRELIVTTPAATAPGQLLQLRVWDFVGGRYLVSAGTRDEGVTFISNGGQYEGSGYVPHVEVRREGDRLVWEAYPTLRAGVPALLVIWSRDAESAWAYWPCAADLCGEVRCAP